MSLRILSRLTLAAALSCAVLPGAVANTTFDPEGRFSGGRPAGAKLRGVFELLQMRRQEVGFETKEKPGTVIIFTKERKLYLVLGSNRAVRYGVGVGRDGYT